MKSRSGVLLKSVKSFIVQALVSPRIIKLYKCYQQMLVCRSFSCGQIYKYNCYEFGHTLLCYLCLTSRLIKPAPVSCEADLFNTEVVLK
jgi:hypothetical protein